MRKLVVLLILVVTAFFSAGCSHDLDDKAKVSVYPVYEEPKFYTYVGSYTEFVVNRSCLDIADGGNLGLELDAYNWFRASQMLQSYGAECHAWVESEVIAYFEARGASAADASAHTEWLSRVWHGFWCYRSGDTMYYIFK